MSATPRFIERLLFKILPENIKSSAPPPNPGADREEQLLLLANQWSIWDPESQPPEGWLWLKDNLLDNYCLVRYCRGRLDRITRREWYKAYRRVNRKMRTVDEE